MFLCKNPIYTTVYAGLKGKKYSEKNVQITKMFGYLSNQKVKSIEIEKNDGITF